MALVQLDFYSEVLGMQTQACVILPQKNCKGQIGMKSETASGKYKCLYLLHGLSDDHTIWMRRTSIERYAAEYGICVVMPCALKSYYTDMKYGLNYYTYIAQELPGIIREFFNVSERREDNYIAGLSMGGYGALKIGLRNCDSFCAAAGLSSVIHADSPASPKEILLPIFGEECKCAPEDDLLYLVRQNENNPMKPRLFVGIGTEDGLYQDNQIFRREVQKLDYDFTYRESAGNHNWEFWDRYIQDVLAWMLG